MHDGDANERARRERLGHVSADLFSAGAACELVGDARPSAHVLALDTLRVLRVDAAEPEKHHLTLG